MLEYVRESDISYNVGDKTKRLSKERQYYKTKNIIPCPMLRTEPIILKIPEMKTHTYVYSFMSSWHGLF